MFIPILMFAKLIELASVLLAHLWCSVHTVMRHSCTLHGVLAWACSLSMQGVGSSCNYSQVIHLVHIYCPLRNVLLRFKIILNKYSTGVKEYPFTVQLEVGSLFPWMSPPTQLWESRTAQIPLRGLLHCQRPVWTAPGMEQRSSTPLCHCVCQARTKVRK